MGVLGGLAVGGGGEFLLLFLFGVLGLLWVVFLGVLGVVMVGGVSRCLWIVDFLNFDGIYNYYKPCNTIYLKIYLTNCPSHKYSLAIPYTIFDKLSQPP